jgi:hypothetical protein
MVHQPKLMVLLQPDRAEPSFSRKQTNMLMGHPAKTLLAATM